MARFCHASMWEVEVERSEVQDHIYQDLIITNDTLHQILEYHGFTNYKLFRKVFFEHFQATPSQIRKRLKQNS